MLTLTDAVDRLTAQFGGVAETTLGGIRSILTFDSHGWKLTIMRGSQVLDVRMLDGNQLLLTLRGNGYSTTDRVWTVS